MIISTDNSVLRSAIGDIEAMRLIAEAGFDETLASDSRSRAE